MPRRMALESRATRVGNLGAFWEAWGMASEVRGRVQWFFRRTRASGNSPWLNPNKMESEKPALTSALP